MAPRAQWKGYLRLSLVSVPVQLYSAVETDADLPLHQIHRPTGERVRHEKVVPGVGPVDPDDIALGYEHEPGRHVLLEEDELRAVAPEASDTIELEQFIGRDELDDIYVERPFFVVPAGKVGDEGYRTLREALRRTRRVAVGEMVLHRRERLVAVRPCGRGMVLETLRYADELRDSARFFDAIADAPPDPAQLRLACELVERRAAPFRPERFRDDYGVALRALVEAKVRGRRVAAGRPTTPVAPAQPKPVEVVDLVQALRRSLDELSRATANRNEPSEVRERRA